jgi:hypothetical protein
MNRVKYYIPLFFMLSAVLLAGALLASAQEVDPDAGEASFQLFMPVTLNQPPPAVPLQNGGFEAGGNGWTEYSALGYEIIVTSFPGSVRPHGGSWAAWLGGDDNETSAISQQVTIPANAPYLRYWHWIASADYCGYDRLDVRINGAPVYTAFLCESAETNGWQLSSLDLAAHAGRTVNLEFRVVTDGSFNSNLFIDDVGFQSQSTSVSNELPGQTGPSDGQDAAGVGESLGKPR